MRRFRSFQEGGRNCTRGIGDACCGKDGFMSPCVIPNFGKDHNYWDSLGQGEDDYTNSYNEPAMRAARTAGGSPFPQIMGGGVNATYDPDIMRRSEINPRNRKLYGGRESDAFHHESVCDILSRLSESYY